MYSFVDVTEQSGNRALPSEALKINGFFLEDEVPGYRTLYVSGRELLGSGINSLTIGASDGERYQNRRYEPRTITVGYQLICESNEAFRAAYNKLNAILDVEEAQLIFNDEPDKYFVGTKQSAGDVPPGRNSITSEIEFFCADSFKYSVAEFEVLPTADDGSTFIVDYKGTYKAYPTFEATILDDNGFIGFIDSDQHILQFGNVDETDGENYKQAEQLTNITAISATDDDNGTNYMHPNHVMSGSLRVDTIGGKKCLCLASKGSGAETGKWNGGMKTFVLPADSEGVYGAKNFYCYLNHWFETGLMGQTGEQAIAFLTADNKEICGYSIFKSDMTGNTATLEMRANGKIMKKIDFQPTSQDAHNPYNQARGHNDIRKEGNKVTFYWFGAYHSFTVPEINNMECHKIQVSFTQYSDRDLGGQYVTRNYLRAIDYKKMYVEKWKDVPNKFMGGDTFSANCRSGEVIHNGLTATGLGVLGNDWEDMCLKPGVNQIKCVHSSWASKPEFKLRYREVYL